MNIKPKVIFNDVSKKYTLQQRKFDKLLEILHLKSSQHSFYALRNVSFTVYEGETIGVVGINGSGKSTMSNLLAQVVPPTTGEIKVNGETSLIAISVGLNNNLTGQENIELKCLMHGLKKEEIKKITPLIIDFADIGDFIDQPVKSYSSGMKSRLGFAISAHTNPDVMVIDEALSVGDQTFYEKCINKMNEFKKAGKTIFFISHSASQVRTFCDKTMWIHYGELVEFGETKIVLESYSKFIKYFNGLSEDERKTYKKEKIALQKMEQLLTQETISRIKRSPKKKNKKNNFVGFIVLFTLFIFSALLLVTKNEFVEGMGKTKPQDYSKIVSEKKKIASLEEKEVKQNGYFVGETGIVYKTSDLKKQLTSLKFMDKVYIDKQVGNKYRIQIGKTKGYIEIDNVSVLSKPLIKSDFNIREILPAFPGSFKSSYEYFLSFLDSDLKDIESKLRGKTGEEADNYGNKYIRFDQIKYRINPINISDAIIVEEINPGKIDSNLLIEKATLKSKDQKLIFILTAPYEFIVDLNQNTVTIRQNKGE